MLFLTLETTTTTKKDVTTLKKTTKFLTGTGTKLDPYVLSANVTGDMAPFKVGDYVTYTGIASYINVSSLSDSGGKKYYGKKRVPGYTRKNVCTRYEETKDEHQSDL